MQIGIYHLGELTLLNLRDDLIVVGTQQNLTNDEMDRLLELLKTRFDANIKFIVVHGDISYQSLNDSAEFRKVVIEIVNDVISKGLHKAGL